MVVLGWPEGSLDIPQDWERLAIALGDEGRPGDCCGVMGIYYAHKGDSPQGAAHAENAFQLAERVQDIELMAQIGLELCSTCASTGGFLRIAEVAPRTLALLEGAQRGMASTAWTSGVKACPAIRAI